MKQTKWAMLMMALFTIYQFGQAQNTFPTSGNTGIGTLSPTNLLEVAGNAQVAKLLFQGTGGSSGVPHYEYAMYQEPGAWTFPYPKLVIHYHTGIKLGGYYGYGGIKFYTGVPVGGAPTGETLSVGDGDQNVRVSNGLMIGDRVAIGASTLSSEHKLTVEGSIAARKVKVNQNAWPDYVFLHDYQLRSIPEMEAFISQHGHLPEVPSAAEVEQDGLDLGAVNATLLKKIEEMSLYIIDLHKRVVQLENR